jgi:probable rRNA maturation factor
MLEIANLTTKRIDKEFFEKIYKIVLRGEKKKGDASLVITDLRKIKSLNYSWRKKNNSTDVLSFVYSEKRNISKNVLGEIFLCPEFIEKLSKDERLNKKEEIARSFIHGILHLLGYDHRDKKELESIILKENKYIKKLFK